jgi:hypothetical protein
MSFIPDDGVDLSQYDLKALSISLPAISVGNIPQLAIDLLITAYKPHGCKLLGYYYDPNNLVPYCAHDALAQKKSELTGEISTGVELYLCTQLNTIFLQQRTPILPKRTVPFVNGLMSWIKDCGFKCVLLLTSAASHKREDEVRWRES